MRETKNEGKSFWKRQRDRNGVQKKARNHNGTFDFANKQFYYAKNGAQRNGVLFSISNFLKIILLASHILKKKITYLQISVLMSHTNINSIFDKQFFKMVY